MKEKKSLMVIIRHYLLSGLLVWVPVWVTFVVLRFLVTTMDQTLLLIPLKYRPENLLGFNIPGLGVIFTLIILLVTGIIAANIFGKYLVDIWDRIIERIPLLSSVYKSVKQVMETMLSPEGKAFRKAMLVEYPRKGMWSVAFQTGEVYQELSNKTGEELVSVFIPTTPNPTSGFLMVMPKKDTIELDMKVEEAFRLVISLGVVHPGSEAAKTFLRTEVKK